jgi:hypothetical protein
MVQSLAATTLTSIAISVASVCATPKPDAEPTADTAFILLGTPEPGLSRPDAGLAEFKLDARYCLAHSADTRAAPPPEASAKVPFRTFSTCMEALGWRPAAAPSEKRLVRPYETLPERYGLSSS